MIVVSDTTPIISLIKAGELGLLQNLFSVVYIPAAVYRELTKKEVFWLGLEMLYFYQELYQNESYYSVHIFDFFLLYLFALLKLWWNWDNPINIGYFRIFKCKKTGVLCGTVLIIYKLVIWKILIILVWKKIQLSL